MTSQTATKRFLRRLEYDSPRYRRIRASLKPLVNAGGYPCWRCGEAIDPRMGWDLGHDDFDRSVIRGPEHRACNRATAGRKKPRAW